ncbi:MAG: cupin domain-containing protein [Pseudomonadales bacterium]|nr:cupin domain-containing protein [Pseudomonadales bacterium]
MTSKHFSSANFGETAPTIEVQMPKRLAHVGIESSDASAEFSAARKHPVHIVDLPSNSISMTIGGLLPGDRSNRHRHTYETIAYILEGRGYSMIEDQKVEWQKGDAIYIPNWAWHHHVNTDSKKSAKYLACENAPMLQNLGQLAIREEEK